MDFQRRRRKKKFKPKDKIIHLSIIHREREFNILKN